MVKRVAKRVAKQAAKQAATRAATQAATRDAGGGESEAKSGAIYRNMMMLSSRKIMKNAVQPPSSDDNSFWRYVPYTSL